MDKGNGVRLISASYTLRIIDTSNIIWGAHKFKKVYVANLDSIYGEDQQCLRVLGNDDVLYHRRLGHVSLSLLNRLISKNLVRDPPNKGSCFTRCVMILLKANRFVPLLRH